MNTTTAAGNRGEAEIARYLKKRGYTLLASQWRCRFGEIDLIARDRTGLLCFVEVKLRTNLSVGLPREFVDRRKREKLRTTAEYYLSAHNLDEPVRFDVAEVYADADHRVTKLEYLESAFE